MKQKREYFPKEAELNHKNLGSEIKILEILKGVGHNDMMMAPNNQYFESLIKFSPKSESFSHFLLSSSIIHNLEFSKYVGRGEPVYYKDVMIIGFDKIRKHQMSGLEEKFSKLDSLMNSKFKLLHPDQDTTIDIISKPSTPPFNAIRGS